MFAGRTHHLITIFQRIQRTWPELRKWGMRQCRDNGTLRKLVVIVCKLYFMVKDVTTASWWRWCDSRMAEARWRFGIVIMSIEAGGQLRCLDLWVAVVMDNRYGVLRDDTGVQLSGWCFIMTWAAEGWEALWRRRGGSALVRRCEWAIAPWPLTEGHTGSPWGRTLSCSWVFPSCSGYYKTHQDLRAWSHL